MELLRRYDKPPRFNLALQNRMFCSPRFVLSVETRYEHYASNGDTSVYVKYVPLRVSDFNDPIIYIGLVKLLDCISANNGIEGPLPELRLSNHGRHFVLEYCGRKQSTSNEGGRVEVWRKVTTRHMMDRNFVQAIDSINIKAGYV